MIWAVLCYSESIADKEKTVLCHFLSAPRLNCGFRKGECGFLQMADIIEETMAKATFDSNPDLDVYLQTDAEARRIATELMLK